LPFLGKQIHDDARFVHDRPADGVIVHLEPLGDVTIV